MDKPIIRKKFSLFPFGINIVGRNRKIVMKLIDLTDTSHVNLYLFSFFLNVNFSSFIKGFIVILHPVYLQ